MLAYVTICFVLLKLERLDEKCAELEEQLQKEQSKSLGELALALPHHNIKYRGCYMAA